MGNYEAIRREMNRGTDLPPISVYQIGSRYFVIDGHTRVAAAKNLGIVFLDAQVIECLPRKEGDVNLTYYARKEFERHTALAGIRLTAPWRYHLLHHHVEGYRLYLERSRGQDVSLPEAARIWHRTQYLPTLLEIRRRKLASSFGGRTSGDVYTDLLKIWAEEEGLAVSLREILERYDAELRAGTGRLKRAARAVTNAVDASLPKFIPPLATSRPEQLTEADVDAELEATDESLITTFE